MAFEPGGKKGGKIEHKEGAPDVFMEVDYVDEVYNNLKEKGVRFVSEPKDQYWGGRTAVFLDPDEYRFILTQMKK